MARSHLGVRALSSPQMGGGNYVYYRGTYDDFGDSFFPYASVVKRDKYKGVRFVPIGIVMFDQSYYNEIEAVAFDLSMKIINPHTGEFITVGDYIAEPSKEWTQITEEEFYKIPTQFMVLTSEDVVYEFIEGQSWRDWINSSANQGNIYIGEFEGKECVRVIDRGRNDFQLYVGSTSQLTHPDDTLVAGEVYFVWV